MLLKLSSKQAEKPIYDDDLVLALLKIAEGINSDFYLSQTLINLSAYINERNNTELKEAYRKVASEINSDSYYGKALKALE